MKVKTVREVKEVRSKKIRLQRITFDTYRNAKIKNDQKITLEKVLGGDGKIF